MSDNQEITYRKSLLITSTILLLYSVAGGNITNKLTYFGSAIEFSRPEFLEYALVAFIVYFFWRHWQTSTNSRLELKVMLDAVVILNSNAKFGPLWKYVINERIDNQHGNDLEVKIIWFGKFHIPDISSTYDHNGELQIFSQKEEPQSKRSKVACILISLLHTISVFIKKPHFANSIFPELISIAALIAYFWNLWVSVCT
ncbi:hypothetical protein [Vibrio vulnificus]|uniref:hypothetical protein n=1 Tax=Vibrio vulnificus TaxID=672 RepID=UPI000C7D5D58|nr:hypothetical protein [Vibrio vulnificus]AUJ35375.1 hypothetical protein BWZ32_11375 [Vibrio vulnificus]HDY7736061.1 hypothetical protein [Vibrio vulnificus]